MKTSKDYLGYCREHPEEKRLAESLSAEEFNFHVESLGYSFTHTEFLESMELARELDEEELANFTGGNCSGQYGVTIEKFAKKQRKRE